MRILALETSCDETAAAVVEDGWKVQSNVIASSLDLHRQTGGVVPEVAARAHVEAVIPVVKQALNDLSPADLDAIAVTKEPGLLPSLLIGIETAKWLSYCWDKPLIEMNHIHGHVYANWLDRDPAQKPIRFPVVCLSVSGGHNDLILIRDHQDWEILGRSQDDAAGEAFDKVARILGLGYPGGPPIEQEARTLLQMAPNVEEDLELRFPRAWLNANNSDKWDGSSFDFSFSGLKSEVLREVEKRQKQGRLHAQDTALIAYAFQEAVFDVLVTKLIGAAKRYEAKEIHIAGGVSANQRLRGLLKERWQGAIRCPKDMKYCTDNAAMIAAAAYFSPGPMSRS